MTQSRQHGAQTTSAHLYWCRADPSSPWPALVVSHGGHCPERIHTYMYVCIYVYMNTCIYGVHVCKYAHEYTCKHMCVSVHIFIYTHTYSEGQRETKGGWGCKREQYILYQLWRDMAAIYGYFIYIYMSSYHPYKLLIFSE